MDDTKKPVENGETENPVQAPKGKENARGNTPFYEKFGEHKRDAPPKKESPGRKNFLKRQADAARGRGPLPGGNPAKRDFPPRRDAAQGRDFSAKKDFPQRGDTPPRSVNARNTASGNAQRDSRPMRPQQPGSAPHGRSDSFRKTDSNPRGDAPRRNDSPRDASFRRDPSPAQQGRSSYPNRSSDAKQAGTAPDRRGEAPFPKRDASPARPQPGTPVRSGPPFGRKPFPPRDGTPHVNQNDRPARASGFARSARPITPPQRPYENPRMTALNVLQDITRADAYAQLALSTRLRESRLDQRDKDLVTELTYGTLERQLTIDYILEQRLERPDVESVVRDILRMGVYQLLYLDRIPASAAVDESVKLTRLMDREPFSGLVNGVLRRIAREKDKDELHLPTREQNPALYLSIVHSLPLWIVERLLAVYGFEETEAIAAYRPQTHPITVRMMPGRMTVPQFEAMMVEKGWQFEPARLPLCYHVFGAGDIGLDQAYQKGVYSVQGESSILAAMAIAPKRGQTILDACAAPGGKTACLAQMMQGTGRVHAADIHEHRVEMIRGMMKRLWLDNVRPAVRDATKVKEDWIDTMDAVLLDAPCSGLGVMLAKPDVKYRRTPESVASLVVLQKELLDACCQYVKPGGVLVYSTCTILPEENSEQVRTFLSDHPQFTLDPEGLRAALPDYCGDRIADGMLQLQAHRDGMEGFFIARMRRSAI